MKVGQPADMPKVTPQQQAGAGAAAPAKKEAAATATSTASSAGVAVTVSASVRSLEQAEFSQEPVRCVLRDHPGLTGLAVFGLCIGRQGQAG